MAIQKNINRLDDTPLAASIGSPIRLPRERSGLSNGRRATMLALSTRTPGDYVGVKVSTSELLLDSLVDNPNIRAALVVDADGYILEQRGNARCVRGVDDEEATITMSKRPQMENIYLVEAGDDFLIVVFDERMNFERLKNSVDSTLENFDLSPESE